MGKSSVSLKLLVDTQANTVLFAEVGNDFVDFLFHIMLLPVATVISLLKEQLMVGSLSNLYRSIENLNASYIQPNRSKDTLLKPLVQAPGSLLTLLRLSDTPTEKKFYWCSQDGGGFVKGVVTYMVMDNLEEKVVNLGMDEVYDHGLEAAEGFSAVRSDVAPRLAGLGASSSFPRSSGQRRPEPPLLGGVAVGAAGRGGDREIKRLTTQMKREFRMKDLGEAKKILGMEITRDRGLRRLCLTKKQYMKRMLNRFGLTIMKVKKLMYAMVYTRSDISQAVGLVSSALCPFRKWKMSTTLTYVASPGREESEEGGFVKGVITYKVMDDLTVMPLSTISGITLLNKFDVKDVSALEETVVNLGCKVLSTGLKSKRVTDVFLD
ncbi:UNVERIFIED_CONTAM: hypothetical protein Scaly_0414100 [Sesamum calycinum]|uniref:Reverse transcriptase Ty1/copia-type domain-containing protein n=1 Tax=Sesamum calycinum TaxID=2727403 RepID=A0AAW2SER9_9LAMI